MHRVCDPTGLAQNGQNFRNRKRQNFRKEGRQNFRNPQSRIMARGNTWRGGVNGSLRVERRVSGNDEVIADATIYVVDAVRTQPAGRTRPSTTLLVRASLFPK